MVRRLMTLVALVALVCLVAVPADAGDGRKGGKDRGARKDRRARILEKFDRDGDGKLNREEKEALRKFLEGKRERKRSRR